MPLITVSNATTTPSSFALHQRPGAAAIGCRCGDLACHSPPSSTKTGRGPSDPYRGHATHPLFLHSFDSMHVMLHSRSCGPSWHELCLFLSACAVFANHTSSNFDRRFHRSLSAQVAVTRSLNSSSFRSHVRNGAGETGQQQQFPGHCLVGRIEAGVCQARSMVDWWMTCYPTRQS